MLLSIKAKFSSDMSNLRGKKWLNIEKNTR